MHRKKLLTAALCLLLAAALLTGGSLAWLLKSRVADSAYTVLSDFEVAGVLTFGGEPYAGQSITVPISFVKDVGNYIGNMKYTVRYTGASPAYLRVRVLEQWTDIATNEILSAGFLNYHLVPTGGPLHSTPDQGEDDPAPIPAGGDDPSMEAGIWVDNRPKDYCYYYSVPVQPAALANTGTSANPSLGDGVLDLTLIDQTGQSTDFVAGINPATTKVELIIEVEAVQPNRYREFWGLTSLPF